MNLKMKIKSCVFGSKNEKELFKTLNTNWSDKLNLYPSLPFVNIIDVSNSNLSEKKKNFLYKTSVDYTLCTKADNPLLSIEFDGLGHGFSKMGEYVQIIPTEDPYRKLKLDLKLKIALKVGYPFFVVSYVEKVPLGKDISLTIVDGIIGQVLARKRLHEHTKELYAEYKDDVPNMRLDEQRAFVEDLMLNAEVESDLIWNPIAAKASQYQNEARRKGLCNGFTLLYPPRDPNRVGCEIIVETPKGEIRETAWVRNIGGFGVNTASLTLDIAKLIAFKRVLDLS